MRSLNLTLFIIIVFGSSCQEPTAESKKSARADKIIDLQPFTDISQAEQIYVLKALKAVYPNIVLKKAIPLPKSAFYAPRKRYRADSLIRYLDRRTPTGHVSIGLTTKDISATKGKIQDWGVMGLGYCPGKACVVSTFRLSKTEKLMQLFKVAIHELGHTQGLEHCEIKSCFMRDAEGRNPTNEETEFCPRCKAFLTKKGWHF